MNPLNSGSQPIELYNTLLMPYNQPLVSGMQGLSVLGVEEVQKKDILAHYVT